MSMTPNPLARPDVVLRELGHEAALFDAASGTTYHLNTTASMIWCLCDGEHPPASIADAIVAVFPDADSGRVLDEVTATLARLAADGLLVAPGQ